MNLIKLRRLSQTIALLCLPLTAAADGLVVDKVYDPYVQALETEIEYRLVALHDDKDSLDDQYLHRIGIGHAVSERWFAEFYVIGTEDENHDLSIDAYELEGKWQLTEQGEFASDWGLLFEMEKERDREAWEFATKVLAVKELGRWLGTANLGFIAEWGEDVNDELETLLSLQLRYRLSPLLEPAIELYSGEAARGIGPVLVGSWRLGRLNSLRWEAGAIAGISSKSPEVSLRLQVEYEFY